MVVVSYSGKEINAKIVYYGPGLGGKTTNLEKIYESVPAAHKGKMISMKTKADRTLFFDFLPIDLGDISGFRTRFMLYTVPGQVYYNATRKLVLKGVDALVFVADSERGKMQENQESLQNLRDNLVSYGVDLENLPLVFQYNKRDLGSVYTLEELDRGLEVGSRPRLEAVASKSVGVLETLREVSGLLLRKLRHELGEGRSPASRVMQRPAGLPAARSAAGPPVSGIMQRPSGLQSTPPAPQRSGQQPAGARESGSAQPAPPRPAPAQPAAAAKPAAFTTPSDVVERTSNRPRPAPAAAEGVDAESPQFRVLRLDGHDAGGAEADGGNDAQIVVPVTIDMDQLRAGETVRILLELRAQGSSKRKAG
jgi:signal recognition particle receptor subunit beta